MSHVSLFFPACPCPFPCFRDFPVCVYRTCIRAYVRLACLTLKILDFLACPFYPLLMHHSTPANSTQLLSFLHDSSHLTSPHFTSFQSSFSLLAGCLSASRTHHRHASPAFPSSIHIPPLTSILSLFLPHITLSPSAIPDPITIQNMQAIPPSIHPVSLFNSGYPVCHLRARGLLACMSATTCLISFFFFVFVSLSVRLFFSHAPPSFPHAPHSIAEAM